MQKDKNAKRQKDALHAHTLQEHILTFSRQAPHWFMLQAMYYIENPTMVSKRACLDFCRQDQLRPPCEASLGLAVIWQRLSAHFAQLCSVYNLHILHSLLEDTWQIHCAHHAVYGCFFLYIFARFANLQQCAKVSGLCQTSTDTVAYTCHSSKYLAKHRHRRNVKKHFHFFNYFNFFGFYHKITFIIR